jgi:hypothetical protein
VEVPAGRIILLYELQFQAFFIATKVASDQTLNVWGPAVRPKTVWKVQQLHNIMFSRLRFGLYTTTTISSSCAFDRAFPLRIFSIEILALSFQIVAKRGIIQGTYSKVVVVSSCAP